MAVDPYDFEQLRTAAAEYTDRILTYPNVIGCGVGSRTVQRRRTDEPSLVVFVSRKVPLSALRADEIIPRAIETASGVVPTDVVERAEPRFLDDTGSYRPLRGGCQIVSSVGMGTLGAVMYDRNDAEVVLLTNNHVLTKAGDRHVMPRDKSVFQPDADGPVGDTKRVIPWLPPPLGDESGCKLQARVDAGIVALDPAVPARFRVIELGNHPYVPLPPQVGLAVVKRGRTGGLTAGIVQEVDVTIIVKDFNGDRVKIGGEGSGFTIKSESDSAFCLPGDSGSLIVDADGGASRGLLFGGDMENGGIGYGCQLSAVMQELQLETPCTGSLNAMFMQALLRRRLVSQFTTLEGPHPFGWSNNIHKFRARYLQAADRQTVAGALEQLFQSLAPEFSDSLQDDDFSGLLDCAVGDWLVQPTVFDMLEYPLPAEFGDRLSCAFDRFGELNPDAEGYEWVHRAFEGCSGIRMREVLTRSAPASPPAPRPYVDAG